MNFKKKAFPLVGLAIAVVAMVSSAGAKYKTFTGTIGDTLCGREHSMLASALECIRGCRGKGSNFSLITQDKVYNLETEDKAFWTHSKSKRLCASPLRERWTEITSPSLL
ncbi:MAG: hypothetical protein WB729_10245 [Candidatus Sulfotelmatobacter sp.]